MVDDHQVEFAAMIADKGLAVVADPDDLSTDHLIRAANLRVLPRLPDPGQIPLPMR
jgi:hypothetical protein